MCHDIEKKSIEERGDSPQRFVLLLSPVGSYVFSGKNRSKKRIVNLLYGLRIERNVDFLLDDVDGGDDIFIDGLLQEREGFPKNIQERITTDETDEMILSSFRLG